MINILKAPAVQDGCNLPQGAVEVAWHCEQASLSSRHSTLESGPKLGNNMAPAHDRDVMRAEIFAYIIYLEGPEHPE